MNWSACDTCKFNDSANGCTLGYTEWINNLDLTGEDVICFSYTEDKKSSD